MNIAMVMQATAAAATGVRYTPFDQHDFKGHQGFNGGICHALCKRWLKTIGQVAPHNFHAEVNQHLDKIVAKQQKANRLDFETQRFRNARNVSLAELTLLGSGNTFWDKFAYAMIPSLFLGRICALGRIHAVATSAWEDNYRFFDPNGGILEFGDDRKALKVFLRDTLKTATTNNYQNIAVVTVREFAWKGLEDDD